MKLEFDPALIEKAVQLAARDDGAVHRELHHQLDPVYGLADGEARERAFAEVFADRFRRLRLDATLRALLAERPLIEARCHRGVVHEAPRRSAESVELYARQAPNGTPVRTLLVQLLPESLVTDERSAALLRRELLHVHDMLSGEFGYHAEDLAGLSPRQHIVRDRYRVLWDISVEARLCEAGLADGREWERLRALFQRTFMHRGAAPPEGAFEAAQALTQVSHAALWALATHPERLGAGHEVFPETPPTGCPLCGFPTFDWFDFSTDIDGRTTDIIRAHDLEWTPAAGACRQCVETYACDRRAAAPC